MHLRFPNGFVSILLAVAVICPVYGQQPPAPEPITDPEAYAVYAAVLSTVRMVSSSPSYGAVLVLQGETSSGQGCPSKGITNPEWTPVLESFARGNMRPWTLLPDRPLGRPYVIAATDEV